ncbi:rodlin [Streptomyces sp. NPDC015127]|uniref:rodlin n=1 Tax=Streptomyces sp. NPDC015127 TaxID=3364939 RepID=UPI0036FCF6A8
MIKKVLATAAVAASVVGISATTAAPAMAGDTGSTATVAGNASHQQVGTSSTTGNWSPNMAVINGGVLNCVDIQKIQGQVPVNVIGASVAVQDVLGNPMSNQTCTQASTQQKGDDALANVLENVLSLNG